MKSPFATGFSSQNGHIVDLPNLHDSFTKCSPGARNNCRCLNSYCTVTTLVPRALETAELGCPESLRNRVSRHLVCGRARQSGAVRRNSTCQKFLVALCQIYTAENVGLRICRSRRDVYLALFVRIFALYVTAGLSPAITPLRGTCIELKAKR